MTYTFCMPYIGGILSKNAYQFPTRGTKTPVRRWMQELATKIRDSHIPFFLKYIVGVRGEFLDERRPDIPNLFGVVADAVQDGLGVNDKHFTLVDNGYITGIFPPQLVITIEGDENE